MTGAPKAPPPSGWVRVVKSAAEEGNHLWYLENVLGVDLAKLTDAARILTHMHRLGGESLGLS